MNCRSENGYIRGRERFPEAGRPVRSSRPDVHIREDGLREGRNGPFEIPRRQRRFSQPRELAPATSARGSHDCAEENETRDSPTFSNFETDAATPDAAKSDRRHAAEGIPFRMSRNLLRKESGEGRRSPSAAGSTSVRIPRLPADRRQSPVPDSDYSDTYFRQSSIFFRFSPILLFHLVEYNI